MVYYDTTYTNGVIASKEKKLLKEKLFRLAELNSEESFRALLDTGFGGGAETAASARDFEKLIVFEEAELDSFIREYAPSEAEQIYLLAPRDFHNAKALVKANFLNRSAEGMLSPNGLLSIETLSEGVRNGDFSSLKALNSYLGGACEEATALLEEEASGAKVGEIFEKALYQFLFEKAKRKPVLKRLLQAKADMLNILTALRAGEEELAKRKYLPFGTLTEKELSKLFLLESESVVKAFAKTPYAEFVKSAISAKEKNLPFTEAERILGEYDVAYFAERKYELKKSEPFLYYVYRRKTEISNVRIVFVCLLAGLSEQEIKKRMRAW